MPPPGCTNSEEQNMKRSRIITCITLLLLLAKSPLAGVHVFYQEAMRITRRGEEGLGGWVEGFGPLAGSHPRGEWRPTAMSITDNHITSIDIQRESTK